MSNQRFNHSSRVVVVERVLQETMNTSFPVCAHHLRRTKSKTLSPAHSVDGDRHAPVISILPFGRDTLISPPYQGAPEDSKVAGIAEYANGNVEELGHLVCGKFDNAILGLGLVLVQD
jgi:hypothetical protein